MISIIKKYMPASLRRLSRKVKRSLSERQEARLTPREAFTRIYLQDKWDDGQKAQLKARFYSGPGSAEEFGRPYAARVCDFMSKNDIRSVIDLGCGDFRVGALIAGSGISYTGIDVVEPLIAENQKRYGNERIRFRCLDMIADELPDADLCLVRQVFQHLSNIQIGQILQKLKKYKWVIVTEDHPGPVGSFIPNIDKPHGTGSRIVKQSGIVFEAPPFNLDNSEIFLDIPAPEITRKDFAPDARIVSVLISANASRAS